MFNPAKAKEREEQEEANRLASELGSTPERAKEVVQKIKEEDLSFQVGYIFCFLFFFFFSCLLMPAGGFLLGI